MKPWYMAKPTTHGQQLTLTAIDQVLKFSKSLKLKAIENITTLFWPKTIVISYLTFLHKETIRRYGN